MTYGGIGVKFYNSFRQKPNEYLTINVRDGEKSGNSNSGEIKNQQGMIPHDQKGISGGPPRLPGEGIKEGGKQKLNRESEENKKP